MKEVNKDYFANNNLPIECNICKTEYQTLNQSYHLSNVCFVSCENSLCNELIGRGKESQDIHNNICEAFKSEMIRCPVQKCLSSCSLVFAREELKFHLMDPSVMELRLNQVIEENNGLSSRLLQVEASYYELMERMDHIEGPKQNFDENVKALTGKRRKT
jgi:hypothetical protein